MSGESDRPDWICRLCDAVYLADRWTECPEHGRTAWEPFRTVPVEAVWLRSDRRDLVVSVKLDGRWRMVIRAPCPEPGSGGVVSDMATASERNGWPLDPWDEG